MTATTAARPLRRLRLERLLSTRGLARAAGCTQATVISTERGRRQPSFETIRRLSAALEVAPAEVIEFRRAMGLPEGEEQS